MPAPVQRALLEVRDLSISYNGTGEPRPVIRNLNFSVAAGEVLGIQGRSGCGKTSTALALLNLLPDDVDVEGAVLYQERNLLTLPEPELRKIRGQQISIVYQEPALALNPVMTIGDQINEVLRAHIALSGRERKDRVKRMLETVRLNPERSFYAYPHELSGGERHRVVLAQALICNPSLVIADEPTAGLDEATKNEILDLIANLRETTGAAFLLISHDRSLIDRLADRRMEFPSVAQEVKVATGLPFSLPLEIHAVVTESEPLIKIRNLSKWYETRGLFRRKHAEKRALDSVDLTIPEASLVALIGPSGSGKSTLARCLALLETPDAGEILFAGKNLLQLSGKQLREHRPLLQYVAQESAEALNPRLTAMEAIEEPLLIQGLDAEARRRKTEEVMRQVGLDPSTASRSCHEFSGGQKQRLVIARALTLKPRLLILDESLSGLDPETQQEILDLLLSLKRLLGIAQLLISHDLHLVAKAADSVALMQEGCIVEHVSGKQVADADHLAAGHSVHGAARQELVLAEAE